ncbi:hypothetical protein [Paracoccus sulfuroxidans]|uniref:Sulfotransferase domain-containing protein n=1 Tax=Paracoccus sulfuroxidans TaxID=384678 RepID=A0A562N7U5_9RHOB|nr:hypothetical protein [Paracoccus sulfuroxidans]TWI28170.1 hypothetical protein IQ24_03787 [Paracoccus sulfuroxidans]
MKKAIIHIGVHKTGTTSIQNWLWNNRSVLSSSFGWEYPKEFSINNAHHAIPWSVIPQFEDNPISRPHRTSIDAIKARVQKKSQVIISSEPFCMADDSEADIIRDIFDGFDTTVVMYVRRQDKLIQSEYVQRVKQEVFPLTEPFSGFSALWRSRVPSLDFFHLYKRWSQRFERVVVKDFDAAVCTGIIKSFLEIIGAESAAPDREVAENISLNYHYIAALREANIIDSFSPGARIELEKKMSNMKFPQGKLSFFKGATAQRYMDQFISGNEKLTLDLNTKFLGFDDKFPYVLPHEYVETDVSRYIDWFQRVLVPRW